MTEISLPIWYVDVNCGGLEDVALFVSSCGQQKPLVLTQTVANVQHRALLLGG